MIDKLNPIIHVTPDGDEVGSLNLCRDQSHQLKVKQSEANSYVSLEFTSRQAMYDFAVSLLQEAVYGVSASKEFYSLKVDEELQVVDGVRMSEESPRLFVSCINK